jgi:hypothetical protein
MMKYSLSLKSQVTRDIEERELNLFNKQYEQITNILT